MDDDKEKDDLLDQIPPEKDPNLDYSLRKVRSPQEAEAIVMALAEKGIPAQMILDGGIMDPIFIGNTPQNKYEILVQEDDKVAADKIFWELAEASIKEIPKDYHLYQYSDAELKQILVESIDWNELDVLLTEKILRDRNVELNFTEIDKSREDRKKQLAEPQSGQEAWIVIGYIFTLLGGFVGLLLGYSFWKAKKRMQDGEKTFAYSASVRTHGKIIFFIALITVTISASLLFVFSAIRAAV